MPKQNTAVKTATMVLGFAGVLAMLLAGIKSVIGWDWGAYFSPIVLTTVGILIFSQGNFKLKGLVKSSNRLVHTISTAVGGALLVLGIGTMPFWTWTLPESFLAYSGVITLVGAVWYIVELYVK